MYCFCRGYRGANTLTVVRWQLQRRRPVLWFDSLAVSYSVGKWGGVIIQVTLDGVCVFFQIIWTDFGIVIMAVMLGTVSRIFQWCMGCMGYYSKADIVILVGIYVFDLKTYVYTVVLPRKTKMRRNIFQCWTGSWPVRRVGVFCSNRRCSERSERRRLEFCQRTLCLGEAGVRLWGGG